MLESCSDLDSSETVREVNLIKENLGNTVSMPKSCMRNYFNNPYNHKLHNLSSMHSAIKLWKPSPEHRVALQAKDKATHNYHILVTQPKSCPGESFLAPESPPPPLLPPYIYIPLDKIDDLLAGDSIVTHQRNNFITWQVQESLGLNSEDSRPESGSRCQLPTWGVDCG
ncbi:hypothetical protein RRG08_015312 [Elysia crispata]|uniref:Uncharacterized protein n=1 Tax=Elysia crispata TaxID=231223 RepID=A0AAE0ZV65_9GAST|nr:hypothetical protein RRG08_015312 [Elysia crispata]